MQNYLKFNHERAYLLGLLVGGGIVSDSTFLINLPYDKWGMNPANMNTIAVDILTKICDKFLKFYHFPVTYEIGNKRWIIKPIGEIDLQILKDDLSEFGLPVQNELINTADLSVIKSKLKGIQVENFLSGIFDTRASLAKSHRRFNDEAPIVSVEIPGSSRNFKLVVQLCSWLTKLGTITDQVLYNHPCQHSPSDPDYSGWKKGFKIRFLAKSFLTANSFAMQAKSFGVAELKNQQTKQEQLPCIDRKPKFTTVSIHKSIDSKDLPQGVRNQLFFHYHHICAVMGCPFAPLAEIKKLTKNYKNFISVFPRLSKGTLQEICFKFDAIKEKYFLEELIETKSLCVKQILETDLCKEYQDLEVGIAYLFSPKLNGKRHIGSKNTIIKQSLESKITVISPKNIEGTPIMLQNKLNRRAILVSSVGSKFNQSIIEQIIEIDGINITIKL
jgi:hypothetical protein